MCSTVQEQITTCGQNAIVKIGERTNIRPQPEVSAEMKYIKYSSDQKCFTKPHSIQKHDASRRTLSSTRIISFLACV